MSDQRVFSLYEARDWFRDHPLGHVHCVRAGDCEEAYCRDYEEAALFYRDQKRGDRDRTIMMLKTPEPPESWTSWQHRINKLYGRPK